MTVQPIPPLIFIPSCPFCGALCRYEDGQRTWSCEECALWWDFEGVEGERVDGAPACGALNHPFSDHASSYMQKVRYRCVLMAGHTSSVHQGVRWDSDGLDPDVEDVHSWKVT